MSMQKAVECIRQNSDFLITTHMNPEGDAIGSQLSLFRLLKALGKNVIAVNEDPLPYGYDFLPGVNVIRKFRKNRENFKFDVFVTVDCSDLRRPGEVHLLNTGHKPVLNIDHHVSNEQFGAVNWVKPEASCCAEMIYELYGKFRVPVDRDTALLLYVGILTDTGSFHYSNTTAFTHRVVSDLMRYDLNITKIYKDIYESVPFRDMRLLAEILPTMNRMLGGKVLWFQVSKDTVKRHKKICFDLSEHILSFGRSVKGTEVVLLFKENPGGEKEVRVNFRSQGNIDVNKIAGFFNGGGHKTAAGATVRGTLESVAGRVLNKVREAYRDAGERTARKRF
ncbi:MAG: bifunctional oligoribonuclease/PAP phosphatase NrnA [Candidatus Omnitrophica bacterium]|nr:bifunctional oligoribonuclease/PAP phosphatase NrnA [Candidatus Omnitrophota bacterium]